MSSYLDQIKDKGIVKLPENPIFKKGDRFEDGDIYPEFSEHIPGHIEDIEAQIKKLMDRTWEVAWLIGKRLIEINEKHLNGTEFKNITDYAHNRFGIAFRTCYRFMFIANHFDQMTARTFGSKLRLLEPLSREQRLQYMSWMEKEKPSYREIEEKIKEDLKNTTRNKSKRKKNFVLSSSRLIIHLNEIEIKKEDRDEFVTELKQFIKEFSAKKGGLTE